MVNEKFMNFKDEKDVFSTQNSLIYGASKREYYELQNPLDKIKFFRYQSITKETKCCNDN